METPAVATEPTIGYFDGRNMSRTDVPLARTPSDGGQRLAVAAQEHRMFDRAGGGLRRPGSEDQDQALTVHQLE